MASTLEQLNIELRRYKEDLEALSQELTGLTSSMLCPEHKLLLLQDMSSRMRALCEKTEAGVRVILRRAA